MIGTVCWAFHWYLPPDSSLDAPSTVPSAMGLVKRAVTVADSIQMTRLGDPDYIGGAPSKGRVAKFSPDGKYFLVVLTKGNLEANTNEYSLVLFQTADVFQSPKPRVLVTMSSSSNRPGIDNVHWLDDSDTILFLGERPGENTQLYTLKRSATELAIRTSSATNLTSFVSTDNGAVVVYAARNLISSLLTPSVSRKGIAVRGEDVTDLIKGSYGGDDDDDHSLFIKRLGKESEIKITLHGRVRSDYLKASLSPDGAHLLVQTEVRRVANTWSEYEDRFLKLKTGRPFANEALTNIFQYELVDTTTGVSQVLVDAPISSLGSEMAWSPDSESVVVSGQYLPLNVDNLAERLLRKSHSFLVEFKLSSPKFIEISDEDLRLVNWDSRTGYVECDVGTIDSLRKEATAKAYFQKSGNSWSKVNALEQGGEPSRPDIILDEGMNTPPRMLAIDRFSHTKATLLDLNPQFQHLAFAQVEEIRWRDTHGNELKGGLYWPPDYVSGKKYPLVVQTHGWNPDRFWIDGPWTTAFAAQALASKGLFVVQVPDPDPLLLVTPKEASTAMAAYEGVIDYLDRRGLIDRRRVGITGFSRTVWYVTYTLTHSKDHFAVAALADGVDYSYFQYMAFSNALPGLAGEFEQVYRGSPFGKTLRRWLTQSPAFLMNRVETPIRFQALGPDSVLFDWHWYSGLSRLGKPVEMIYIPEGTHVLEKPWDRMTSQQGDVDWFCFWLKHEEDPNPEKAEQYQRWRELRSLESQQMERAVRTR